MNEKEMLQEQDTTSLITPNQYGDEFLELIREDEKVRNADPSDVLRIEEKRSKSWSGVRGCCDQNTVDAEAKAIFQAFLQEKIYQYRHMRYINSGHGGGTASCSNSTSPWPDNRRSCRGFLELTCWAEFMPQ